MVPSGRGTTSQWVKENFTKLVIALKNSITQNFKKNQLLNRVPVIKKSVARLVNFFHATVSYGKTPKSWVTKSSPFYSSSRPYGAFARRNFRGYGTNRNYAIRKSGTYVSYPHRVNSCLTTPDKTIHAKRNRQTRNKVIRRSIRVNLLVRRSHSHMYESSNLRGSTLYFVNLANSTTGRSIIWLLGGFLRGCRGLARNSCIPSNNRRSSYRLSISKYVTGQVSGL